MSVLFLSACGGSSSETPMPLEPLPHVGPEPAALKEPMTPAESTKNLAPSSAAPSPDAEIQQELESSEASEPAVQPEQEDEPDNAAIDEAPVGDDAPEELNPAGELSPSWDD